MFASMLGVFLSAVILLFLIVALVGALVSSAGDKVVKIEPATILHINFTSPIRDRTSDNPFENFKFNTLQLSNQPGLNDIIKNLKKAAADDNISGIQLDLSQLAGGLASVEEIRHALVDFKKSGKFILAYSDFYTQGSYYLASVADEVWVNPQGAVDFRGFAATLPFLKGLFEKLEIQPQVIRHGKFKSAVEPFVLDKMSDENRAQIKSYVDAFWGHYVREIAFTRKLVADSLFVYASEMRIQTPEDALNYKMIDKIGYMDEFLGLLKEKTGKLKTEELKTVSLKKYTHVADPSPAKEFTRDKIAVVYASGAIVGGKGEPDEIGSDVLSETIRKARNDDKVKAVVLRVNSPGGDALASEVIWREMELCRKVKPVIVSMGDVAASGGYYISCAADKIVAQPNTVTGSIGVFGLLFNARDMFNNKLGITFDTYRTGEFSDIGTMTRAMTPAEEKIIRNSVERVYTTFTTRVADGRKMSVTQVDSVGQGRVWSGTNAMQLGLVDTLGGLSDAIKIAADKAGLTNYRLSELPEQKDPLQQLLKELEGDVQNRYLKWKLGEHYQYLAPAITITRMQGIQTRMMFDILVN